MERIKIGTLEVTNETIIAIDPCYKKQIMGASFKAKNGTYNVYVCIVDDITWGKRVMFMEAIHTDDDHDVETLLWEYESDCPVDSGTFSFMDVDYYNKTRPNGSLDERWYEKSVIGMTDKSHIIDNRVSICESGYGDGLYEVDVVYDDDNEMCETICAIRVTFICDDEYEEE